jgi:hypothetical protein
MRKTGSRILERHGARETRDFGNRYVRRHPNPANCGAASHVVDHHDCFKAGTLLPNPQNFGWTEVIFNVICHYLHELPPEKPSTSSKDLLTDSQHDADHRDTLQIIGQLSHPCTRSL